MKITENIKNEKLTDLKLFSEETNGKQKWYLRAEGEYETNSEICYFCFPKMRLHIDLENMDVSEVYGMNGLEDAYVDIGFGKLKLEADQTHTLYSKRVISKKKKRMTLADIERELGYQVELVSKIE